MYVFTIFYSYKKKQKNIYIHLSLLNFVPVEVFGSFKHVFNMYAISINTRLIFMVHENLCLTS